MKQFKNEWSRLHDAMVANIKGKEELIEKVIADNVMLQEEIEKLKAERKGE